MLGGPYHHPIPGQKHKIVRLCKVVLPTLVCGFRSLLAIYQLRDHQKRKFRHCSSSQSLWQSTFAVVTLKPTAKRYRRRVSNSILGICSGHTRQIVLNHHMDWTPRFTQSTLALSTKPSPHCPTPSIALRTRPPFRMIGTGELTLLALAKSSSTCYTAGLT